MSYIDIINRVSKELDLPEKVVDRTYKAYWLYIKEHIKSLPLKQDLTEEEFLKLRTNFNIPSIGKFYCTLERFLNTKKRFELIKLLNNKK